MPRTKPTKRTKRAKKSKRVVGHSRGAVPTVKGRGGYTSALKNIGGGVGALFGPAGAMIGAGAGELLGTLFGRGAYKLNRNSLVMGNNGPPVFGDGSITLTHREFITDITGSTAFSNYAFRINPGSSITFPWLSTIALNFQSYEFLGLIFEYKATSATAVNSTNTALGTVVMATNYDADAPAFLSKQQMEAYEFATSTAPMANAIHPVECSPVNMPLKTLYIQSPNQTTSDRRFMDLGEFNIATAGMQAASTIGELWVSYHVKLSKPALPSLNGLNDDMWTGNTTTGTSGGPFSNIVNTQYGGMNAFVPSSSVNSLCITQPGYYQLTLQFISTGTDFTGVATAGLGSNINGVGQYPWGGPTVAAATAFNSTIYGVAVYYLQVTAPGTGSANYVTCTGPTSVTNLFYCWGKLLCIPPPYAALNNANSPLISAVAPTALDGKMGDIARALDRSAAAAAVSCGLTVDTREAKEPDHIIVEQEVSPVYVTPAPSAQRPNSALPAIAGAASTLPYKPYSMLPR